MSMETAIQTFTLSKLVAEYPGGIRIPMIQRDYAQGRPSWENPRKRFLLDLKQALRGEKSLHLDFVYGVKQAEDDVTAATCSRRSWLLPRSGRLSSRFRRNQKF